MNNTVQPGLLRILRSIWTAKTKVNRAEVEQLADELEKEGLFDDEKQSVRPQESALALKR